LQCLVNQRTILLSFSKVYKHVLNEFYYANSEGVSHQEPPRILGFDVVDLLGVKQKASIDKKILLACRHISSNLQLTGKTLLLILVDGLQPVKQYQNSIAQAIPLIKRELVGSAGLSCKLIYVGGKNLRSLNPPPAYVSNLLSENIISSVDTFLCSSRYSDQSQLLDRANIEYLLYNTLNLLVFSGFSISENKNRYWSINPLAIEFPLPLLQRQKMLKEVFRLVWTDFGDDDDDTIHKVSNKLQEFFIDKIGAHKEDNFQSVKRGLETGKFISLFSSSRKFKLRVNSFFQRLTEFFRKEDEQHLNNRHDIKKIHRDYKEKLNRLRPGLEAFWQNDIWDTLPHQAGTLEYWYHLIEALEKLESEAKDELDLLAKKLSQPAWLGQLSDENMKQKQLLIKKLKKIFASYGERIPAYGSAIKKMFLWYIPFWICCNPYIIQFFNQFTAVLPSGIIKFWVGIVPFQISRPFLGIKEFLNGEAFYSLLLGLVLTGVGVFRNFLKRKKLRKELNDELEKCLKDKLPQHDSINPVDYVRLIWEMRLWRNWKQLMQEYRVSLQQLRDSLDRTSKDLQNEPLFSFNIPSQKNREDFFKRETRLKNNHLPLVQFLPSDWFRSQEYTTLSDGFSELKRILSDFIRKPLTIKPNSLHSEVSETGYQWFELQFQILIDSIVKEDVQDYFVELVQTMVKYKRLPWPIEPRKISFQILGNSTNKYPFYFSDNFVERLKNVGLSTDFKKSRDPLRWYFILYGELDAKKVEGTE